MPGPRRELRVFRPAGASLIRRKPPTYHFAETCGFRRLGWKSRTAHIRFDLHRIELDRVCGLHGDLSLPANRLAP